jgi:hypothetical protein
MSSVVTREPLHRRARTLELWLGDEVAGDVRRRRALGTRLPVFRDLHWDGRFVLIAILGPFLLVLFGLRMLGDSTPFAVTCIVIGGIGSILVVRYLRLPVDPMSDGHPK